VIESRFATVRLRERATRGAGSRSKGLLIASKLLDICLWFVPGSSSPDGAQSILPNTLLSQLTINLRKPPDHGRPIHNI